MNQHVLLARDVESNPGPPKRTMNTKLSFEMIRWMNSFTGIWLLRNTPWTNWGNSNKQKVTSQDSKWTNTCRWQGILSQIPDLPREQWTQKQILNEQVNEQFYWLLRNTPWTNWGNKTATNKKWAPKTVSERTPVAGKGRGIKSRTSQENHEHKNCAF